MLPEIPLLFSLLVPHGTEDPAALVNPFVGTDGHGHTHPAATLPFGMVQLGPDTRLEGWDGCSGYHWSDSRVYGFSHTHLSGTGVSDYGDVLFKPGVGEVRLNNGADGEPGYSSPFSHDEEEASPGFYGVRLADSGVQVQLTATERVGLHRYLFPEDTEDGHVVLDLAHRDPVLESNIRIIGPNEIEGLRRSRQWASDQRVYFVARFSRPFAEHGFAVDGAAPRAVGEAVGTDLRAFFRFEDAGDEPLLVKVALSAVDAGGARRNLEAELPGWDFEATRAAARRAWNDELSRIDVRGGTHAQRRTFYTALYHAFLAPNLFSDVDGRFRGMDGQIHKADHDVYTVFSLWDTFRAAHPLFTLVQRERTVDFLRTFERQFDTGGKLPIWELAGNYTGCMIGYHAIPVIADAWLKGIEGFDRDKLYEAMKVSAEDDVLGLDAYKRVGYVPSDHESESVSKTLEYAYDDWCIARVAEALGKHDDAERYDRRARAYEHLFDPATGFLRPRRNGAWLTPFDPREVNFNFTEANAWQYRFFVPHDVAGLARLLGGEDRLERELDRLFTAEARTTGRDQADITGLIGQYAHGNEPSHHVAWLYNYVGSPARTQDLVGRILSELYDDGPAGLSGNEDCGQMSAWYVLAAAGIYPVCPGSGEYALIAPLFERVAFRFEDGVSFTIDASRPSPEDRYVQGAALDEEPHPRSALQHADLVAGGSLRFTLGPEPSAWGTAPEHRPRSRMTGGRIVPVPYVESDTRVFRSSIQVGLAHHDPEVRIHLTLDGSPPTAASSRYTEPLTFEDTTRLRAVAVRSDGAISPPIEARFHRIDNAWSLDVQSEYSSQYTAGGDIALIDGLRGGSDFRTGSWQGFHGRDMVVVLDLGRERSLERVAVGFLQEVRSWIWMPRALRVEVSLDGAVFEPAGRVTPQVREDDYTPRTAELGLSLGGRPVRFLRLTAEDAGPIPEWHPGRGGPRWIFADEILVE